jgi:N,N-dimethylformamidase
MLTGYSDRLSLRPGERLPFRVSTDAAQFDVRILRLRHGDSDPRGPGRRDTPLDLPENGRYKGKAQRLPTGSYGVVPHRPALQPPGDFTALIWFWPTLAGEQAILSKTAPDGAGFEIGLTHDDHAYVQVGDARITVPAAVQLRRWHWLAAVFGPSMGSMALSMGLHGSDLSMLGESARVAGQMAVPLATDAPLVMAAALKNGCAARFFNGKLADPCLVDHAMAEPEIARWVRQNDREGLPDHCRAAWDFGLGCSGTVIHDRAGRGFDGYTVQSPVRSMTGPHWRGDTPAPGAGSAIHFHEDSLADAGWDESFGFHAPDDLPSGVYAARLTAADECCDLPFLVLPPKGKAAAPLAFLMPTFTYVAYGNELYPDFGLNCVYDRYTDGAGVPLASVRHPIQTFRPDRGLLTSVTGERFGRHLCADLYLVDFLADLGQPVDILCDHDLHCEGAAQLAPYKGVITGSHPEYVSGPMLDALEAYLSTGGNLAYLGGNGFYSVTTLSEDGSQIEVRRPNGSRPWTSDAGEDRHQMTGEPGGLWRFRGRAPQRLVGVGFAGQGWTSADACGLPRPFDQVADRTQPLAAALLAGIPPGAKIGDFATLGLGHGAAGDEVDRTDPDLGTPVQTVVLATANGFSTDYQVTIDDRRDLNEASTLPDHPMLRADMVCFPTPGGGFVFSASSMQWFSALSHNGYDNTVATITRNVIARMLR